MSEHDTPLSLRPLSRVDEPAVLDLLSASLGGGPTGGRTIDFFRWKHRENPAGESPGLVAEHEGRIVGVRLFLRWDLWAAGEQVRAVRAVDTATDPAFRGRGIFRSLTLGLLDTLEQADEVDLVFNTPNANSRPGYLKMGWHAVGTLPVRIRPVHPVRFARGALQASRSSAATERPQRVPPKRVRPHREIRVGAQLGSASTVLSERGADVAELLELIRRPPGLHTPLSLPFLDWRYGAAPDLDYRCLVVEERGRITGLGLGRFRWRGPLLEFTLSEVLVRGGDRRTAQKLLRQAAQVGADHVATHTAPGSASERAAIRTAYVTVPRQGLGLVVNPRRSVGVDPLDPRSWQLSLGDLEVF